MGISLKELKELTELQILNKILSKISFIYLEYNFIGISKEEFNKIVLMEIKKSKKTLYYLEKCIEKKEIVENYYH